MVVMYKRNNEQKVLSWDFKIFTWKHLTIWRPVFWGFPRAQTALFSVSTLNSFQGDVKGQHLVVVIFSLCRGSWQGPTSSQQSPFTGTYLTMFWGQVMAITSHSAGKAHSQVYWRSHRQATQCAITRPGLASSKVSGPYLSY